MSKDAKYEWLDGLSELVYISDIKTYKILYINTTGRTTLGIADLPKGKCYEVLQNRTEPCEFCTTSLLSKDAFYTWEHFNPISQRHYLLKDRLIDWEGRLARLEIAFDMTEQILQKQAIQDRLDMERVLLNCVRKLYQDAEIDVIIQDILAQIGEFLQAERVYVFNLRAARMDNTYEWCAPGVTPEIDNLQGLDIRLIDRWRDLFATEGHVIIRDLQAIREISPDEYAVLAPQGIHSLIAAPMLSSGRLVGYLGVDNPSQENISRILPMLTTLSYFLTSSLEKKAHEKLLLKMSYEDSLTGVSNRNRYVTDLAHYERVPLSKAGVLFLDLNDLKIINDEQGHAAGDKTLTETTRVMKRFFPSRHIYRVGGDEFVILCPEADEATFLENIRQLREELVRKGICAAMGHSYSQGTVEIATLISHADGLMYKDKRACS